VNTNTVYLINLSVKHDAFHSPHYRSHQWYLIFWRFPFKILTKRLVIPPEVFCDFPETLKANSSRVILNVSFYVLPSLSFIVFLPFVFLHDTTSAVDTVQVDTLHSGHVDNIIVCCHSSVHSCCSEWFIGLRLLAPGRKMFMFPDSNHRPLYALRYNMYALECCHIFHFVPKLKYGMAIVMYDHTYHNYANKFYHSRHLVPER
jgi:hypothetical protein